MIAGPAKARWRIRLEKELAYRPEFDVLDRGQWATLLGKRRVTSTNYDTVVAIDWPHYCTFATEACGGRSGWCYTFQGHQANANHNRRAAMTDSLARKYPDLFADIVVREVTELVSAGTLPYPNLRYAGAGEATQAHLPALAEVAQRGVALWGFTRNLKVAEGLRALGASVIVSCDRTTSLDVIAEARRLHLPLAWTAVDVDDLPPEGTVVTFPVHRVGRVSEVVETPTLCPKVLDDFFLEERPEGSCQHRCQRCHRQGG